MISELFQRIIKLLIAIVGLLIFLIEIQLIREMLLLSGFRFFLGKNPNLEKVMILLPIASAVEVALIWLLVVLNAISLRRGLIATLILFILVGITFLIIYSYAI